MSVHYSNGTGYLHNKEQEGPVAEVQYQLIETDPTKYAPKKWWGGFYTNQEIKQLGNYKIEFADGRVSECAVVNSSEPVEKDTRHRYYYRFYSRGRLGKR